MRLVIGGQAQGKLNYVLQNTDGKNPVIFDGIVPPDFISEELETGDSISEERLVIINHLHCWIKKCITQCAKPEEELRAFLGRYPDCVIICDEIGNGIVPLEKEEREYRERTGRVLIELAGRAETVERVICGLSQKIK